MKQEETDYKNKNKMEHNPQENGMRNGENERRK
jgi:hypothetical protein